MNSGIYCIENVITNEKYIGLSCSLKERLRSHKYDLKRDMHGNNPLQESYNKYGRENFIYSIIEECEEKLLGEREDYYIVLYKTIETGFNDIKNV